MPQKKKRRSKGIERRKFKKSEYSEETAFFVDHVYLIRGTVSGPIVDIAFIKLVDKLDAKIKKVVGKYASRIPGMTFDDVYQEALLALRTKAIEDYDERRGRLEGPAPFDHFAMMCIRRHLATAWKNSRQNRLRVLNECRSLDQDRGSEDDELHLGCIIPDPSAPIYDTLDTRQVFNFIFGGLIKKLSPLEKKVFILYAQGHTYLEVADILKRRYPDEMAKFNYKGVDNALSRCKQKLMSIMNEMNLSGRDDYIENFVEQINL